MEEFDWSNIFNKRIACIGLAFLALNLLLFYLFDSYYYNIPGEKLQLYTNIIVSILAGISVILLNKNISNMKEASREGIYQGIFMAVIFIIFFYISILSNQSNIGSSMLMFISVFLLLWGCIFIIGTLIGAIISFTIKSQYKKLAR